MVFESLGFIFALFAAFVLFFIILAIISYIYFSLTLMITAKRLGTKNAWLAWIPIINIYLFPKIARKKTWPLVFIYVPFLFNFFLKENDPQVLSIPLLILGILGLTGAIFSIYWFIHILKRRGKPWWWLLLFLIPIFNLIWIFIVWGILAWGKESSKEKNQKENTSKKEDSPDMDLVHYLRKYNAEGYPIAHLREHLIKEGESPSEIDKAIRSM